jgi:hypothetical protein
MEHKIKITKEQSDLFKHTGSIVSSSNGDVYMNIPYWLKETDEENVYEYLTTEQLPNDIKKQQQCYSNEELQFIIESLLLTRDKALMFSNSFDNTVSNEASILIEKLTNSLKTKS